MFCATGFCKGPSPRHSASLNIQKKLEPKTVDEPPPTVDEQEVLESEESTPEPDEIQSRPNRDIEDPLYGPLSKKPLPTPPPAVPSLNTRDLRAKSHLNISYALSPYGLLIPFKMGPSVSYIASSDFTIEASYQSGSIGIDTPYLSLGGIHEEYTSVGGRYYFGTNSFNLFGGIHRQVYDARLGSDILARMSGGAYPPNVDLLRIVNLGIYAGIGNRWQIPWGLTFGVDWLTLYVPLKQLEVSSGALDYVTDKNDRDNIETGLKIFKYIPTGAVTRLSIGYSF